jgi:hypothetical protein
MITVTLVLALLAVLVLALVTRFTARTRRS